MGATLHFQHGTYICCQEISAEQIFPSFSTCFLNNLTQPLICHFGLFRSSHNHEIERFVIIDLFISYTPDTTSPGRLDQWTLDSLCLLLLHVPASCFPSSPISAQLIPLQDYKANVLQSSFHLLHFYPYSHPPPACHEQQRPKEKKTWKVRWTVDWKSEVMFKLKVERKEDTNLGALPAWALDCWELLAPTEVQEAALVEKRSVGTPDFFQSWH